MRGRMATWAGLRVEWREAVGEVVDEREGRDPRRIRKMTVSRDRQRKSNENRRR